MAMSNNYFWANNHYYTQVSGIAMGARYAPSVANIVLNKWEHEMIFRHRHDSLKFYKGYIDDVIIFWEGTESDLHLYIAHMNQNKYGLKFSAEVSNVSINYLDLTIRKNGVRFETLTFFKPTDRNGFVPTSSCHHPQWLGTIPKGQYIILKRNSVPQTKITTCKQSYSQQNLLKKDKQRKH